MRVSPPSLLILLTLLLKSVITTTTTTKPLSECVEVLPLSPITNNLTEPAITNVFDLGFKLLAELKEKDNLVISPRTIWELLSILAAGAEGRTLKQILSVLGVKDRKGIFSLSQTLFKSDDDDVIQIYIQKGFNIKKCKKELSNFITPIDFANTAQTCDIINNFIRTSTQGLIQNALTPSMISPQSRMTAITLYHLSSRWMIPFDKIIKREFYESPLLKHMVDMMYKQQMPVKYGVMDPLKASVLQLAYNNDKRFMTILVPAYETEFDVDKVIASMSYINFKLITGNLTALNCEVYLPKFNIYSKFSRKLTEALKKLGLEDLFDPAADFSSFHEDLYMNQFFHHAWIEVDEKHTTGISNSSNVSNLRNRAKGERIIEVNSPFIFLIHTSQDLLFAGVYLRPPIIPTLRG